jgi:hypothetical protein
VRTGFRPCRFDSDPDRRCHRERRQRSPFSNGIQCCRSPPGLAAVHIVRRIDWRAKMTIGGSNCSWLDLADGRVGFATPPPSSEDLATPRVGVAIVVETPKEGGGRQITETGGEGLATFWRLPCLSFGSQGSGGTKGTPPRGRGRLIHSRGGHERMWGAAVPYFATPCHGFQARIWHWPTPRSFEGAGYMQYDHRAHIG